MPDDATSPAPRLHRRIGTRPMLAGASAITFLVGTAEASAPDSATQCRAMACSASAPLAQIWGCG